MKKFILFCIALLMIGVGTTQMGSNADAAFSKDEAVRERFALKKERLSKIVSQKIARVENSIKTKLKEQEIKKNQKQKEEAKKAAEKQAEEKAAESQAQNAEAQAAEQQAQVEVEQPPAVYQPEEAAPVEENTGGAEAVSGASGNWQERNQKNREWGNQLSDPNLTPAERQGIIQEKKNYNRNNY
ncbi:hypothetical protein [Enterococcus termitis]|uniref:Uncharacterized protein n=1 Tax=Enterococcus termitis TaxID=332950 RepID=A0A1E5GCF7_9ENTE|nr:hypothetical protein [Enterococcus termitis]OEG09940.1 hypothetical protein BCR25_10595 [Enterococcus termitis]